MKQDANPSSDYQLLFLGGIVVIALLAKFVERTPTIALVKLGLWAVLVLCVAGFAFWYFTRKKLPRDEELVFENGKDATFCGWDKENRSIFVRPQHRRMHTQVIGTTNAGKTESVILPWAIQDVEQGRGLLLIDGKADRSLLDKLYAYAVKSGRRKDFRLFSLGLPEKSFAFDPLTGGTPNEIAERVFNAFEFENEFYKSLQYELFSHVLRIFDTSKVSASVSRVYEAIQSPSLLEKMMSKSSDEVEEIWIKELQSLDRKAREERSVGLLSALGPFVFGEAKSLFQSTKNTFTIDEALDKNLICYFQLPVLRSPFLGKATGKLVLQALQSAIARRHSMGGAPKFFSVFLDDFSEYLYPGFVSILNKSRSANVGVVFAHQALGDITALGDAVSNAILTNSNIKVVMRGNDPVTAEYFSKVFGTNKTEKVTERTRRELLRSAKTGDASVREVEEFLIHPNYFKRELGVGRGVMLLPQNHRAQVIDLECHMFPKLSRIELPNIEKEFPKTLRAELSNSNENPISDLAV